MEQLLESTLDLVADQNGNHVIQKCIECIKPTIHIEPLIGVRPTASCQQPLCGLTAALSGPRCPCTRPVVAVGGA